ncbi:hypothetical protein [Intestinimonas sp. HCP28S3_D6]|uniref:hypothetical protein n=1 Tax=Intestinimonas sp. HCP28S3_D6 TaxID=3438942 RepID=UPI003F8AAE25
MKKILLWVLAAAMMLSLAACGKSEAAKAVDDQIAAIGTVTLESADAITAARSLYDGSEAEVQSAVNNLGDLEAAEAALSDLRVAETVSLIDAIGAVTLESADAVDAAQASYDSLSEADTAKVSNADVLIAAADQLKALKQQQAQAILANMRVEKDEVRGLTFYYSKTQPYYADERCYVLPYIGQDSTHTWLCAQYHYMDYDNWVFWTKLTFAVDDQRYYKYFNYFDVVRDNDTEVWEYVNTADVSEEDIEMFWAIANSEKTIVRFEGDEYYSDFTVSQADKDAIREVLTAYEALQ